MLVRAASSRRRCHVSRRPHRWLADIEVVTGATISALEGRDDVLDAVRSKLRGSGEGCGAQSITSSYLSASIGIPIG